MVGLGLLPPMLALLASKAGSPLRRQPIRHERMRYGLIPARFSVWTYEDVNSDVWYVLVDALRRGIGGRQVLAIMHFSMYSRLHGQWRVDARRSKQHDDWSFDTMADMCADEPWIGFTILGNDAHYVGDISVLDPGAIDTLVKLVGEIESGVLPKIYERTGRPIGSPLRRQPLHRARPMKMTVFFEVPHAYKGIAVRELESYIEEFGYDGLVEGPSEDGDFSMELFDTKGVAPLVLFERSVKPFFEGLMRNGLVSHFSMEHGSPLRRQPLKEVLPFEEDVGVTIIREAIRDQLRKNPKTLMYDHQPFGSSESKGRVTLRLFGQKIPGLELSLRKTGQSRYSTEWQVVDNKTGQVIHRDRLKDSAVQGMAHLVYGAYRQALYLDFGVPWACPSCKSVYMRPMPIITIDKILLFKCSLCGAKMAEYGELP